MTRTPDDIKKGLECCLGDTHAYHCDECPYSDDESDVDDGCGDNGIQLLEDAIALIQQLQAQNAELLERVERLKADVERHRKAAIECCYKSKCSKEIKELETLSKRLMDEKEQLQAERDAAVAGIPRECGYCKHDGTADFDADSVCDYCYNGNTRWEWRGVQKEE